MPRNKPYGKGFAIFEALVLLFTGFAALIWIFPREIYRWTQPSR